MDGRISSILDSLEAELEEIRSLSSSSQTEEQRDGQMRLGGIRSSPSSPPPQAEAREDVQTQRYCISRVPDVLKELINITSTVDAFAPQLVSFGPYHHSQARLRAMDDHKVQALYKYLNKAKKSLAQVTEAMRPHLEGIKNSYVGLDEQWKDEERFLKLMILDGCFFLDAMIWKSTPLSPYMVTRVNMDMLRLENQLPLLVLATLIKHGGNEEQDRQAFKNLFRGLTRNNSGQDSSITEMGRHHLDLNRKCRASVGTYVYDSCHGIQLPATKLKQSGVRLARSRSSSFKDISFSNGVLRLPFLEFMDNTETLLLNFLAYEQIFDVDNAVTSYAFFMDNLIDTVDDVVLLREKGIFRVSVGSDEGIAALFNSLTKTLAYPLASTEAESDEEARADDQVELEVVASTGHHRANRVNEELNEYCSRWWPKLRASFEQTYLPNLWVPFSVLGAIILLGLTIVQTIFTILTYYDQLKNNKSQH